MTNKDLIRQYANTGAILTRHQLNLLPGSITNTYLRRRIKQMESTPYSQYDVTCFEVLKMPNEMRSSFFGMLSKTKQIDDILYGKSQTPDEIINVSLLFLEFMKGRIDNTVIYILVGANRGEGLKLITDKIIEYKGDTLDYNDVSDLARKIENPREYLKYPRFAMGLRKIGGMGEGHLSSLMNSASNSQELGEIFIELDATERFLQKESLNYIMMSVNQPEEIFKKLGSKRQEWWRTFITKNDIYDIMTYSRKPFNVLKTLPKETVQQGIDGLSIAELDKALKFGRDTELIVNLKHLGFDLKEYND